MKRFYLILIILTLFESCSYKKEPAIKSLMNNNNSIILSLNTLDVSPVDIDSLFEMVFYIKPEVTEESLISNYSKVIIKNEKIFIMDNSKSNQAIFIFDMDGKFLYSINKRGNGPGEYLSISDFYVDEKNNIIGVLSYSQLLKYDLQGKFIEKIDLRKHYISEIVTADNLIYAYTFSQCFTNNCYSLKIFDQQGQLLYEDIPMQKDLISSPLTGFKPNNLYVDFADNVYLNTIYNDTVFEVNVNRIRPVYIADFGQHKLPDKIFSELIEQGNNVDIASVFQLDYILFGLKNILFTKDYCYFTFNGHKSYMSFYSLKTNSIKVIQTINAKDQIPPFEFIFSDENYFYNIFSTSQLIMAKDRFEKAGILEFPEQFSPDSKKYYNEMLRDVKEEDNPMIVAYRIKCL